MRLPTLLLALAALPAAALPATAAEDPPYRDDRSDPAAIVDSLYNAIARGEYARAWGYFGETKPVADYQTFVAGYADTTAVRLALGAVISEGAAGSIYATVPAALEATDDAGKARVFAGCYVTRQLQPAAQEPPFRPLQIERGSLQPRDTPFEQALPQSCDPNGKPVF